jgi:hypothetical protein
MISYCSRNKVLWFAALLLGFLISVSAHAQMTQIRGRVTDSTGNEGLPFVSVSFVDGSEGTHTDDDGYYQLTTDRPYTELRFSYLGYQTEIRDVAPGRNQEINVVMTPVDKMLGEVVVRPKRIRYRNKDNPAVELIREVIARKPQNRMDGADYVEYRQYEKMKFSLSNTPEKLKKDILLRRYKFLTEHLDTITLPGKALLPWYMLEGVADVYYRKNPERRKTIVVADKRVDFGEYVDRKGLNAYLRHMYQDIDLYTDNIRVVTNEFLSPIAGAAPTFYRYYITDTLQQGDMLWVELSFFPRNKADFMFQGRLYIPLDGSYALARADIRLNRNINLNWVRDLTIVQEFAKNDQGKYYLSKSTLQADFSLLKSGGGPGMFGERTVAYSDYVINRVRPDSLYKGQPVVSEQDTAMHDDAFWQEARPDTLTSWEAETYVKIDSLKNMKSFRRTLDLMTMAIVGYKKASPYVEIGPVNTFYSFNPVEGQRIRVGARTTPTMSKRIYLESYAAYGLKDERWKYLFGTTWSFTGRSIFEFPVRSLKVYYQKDTRIPGQDLPFLQEGNFLFSFTRGVNDKWLYNDIWNAEYLHEFRNHFSYKIGLKNWRQSPAGGLQYFRYDGSGQVQVNDLTTSEALLELRWAPNELFYQGKAGRTQINTRYPIFTMRTRVGMKGVMNSEYDYQAVALNVYKHVFAGQFGYSDVVLEGGYYFGRAPFPLLVIHRANQTYALQNMSFNMMNFLEFVSDQYASLYVDHCFNGFFFNKIPLFKKLKLREVVNGKMLYGGLRPENNPANNNDLFRFPVGPDGLPATYTLAGGPYIEGSVGVSNILNFFRIDLVKRFTYLHHPHVSELGVRARLKFDF